MYYIPLLNFYKSHILFIGIFILLLSFKAFANSLCEKQFSKHPFVELAIEKLGESWKEEMPDNWENKTMKYTRSWAAEDMERFLSYLRGRIGAEEALKRIRSVSYFQNIRYERFIDFVLLYESYIGVEGVMNRLKKTLNGFNSKREVGKTREVIEFMKSYIGEEVTKELMKNNLQGFASANLKELKKVVTFVEDYIGKEATKERMKNNLQGFASANLKELKEIVAFVEDYIGKEATKERMKNNLRGFSSVNLIVLQKKEKLWEHQ